MLYVIPGIPVFQQRHRYIAQTFHLSTQQRMPKYYIYFQLFLYRYNTKKSYRKYHLYILFLVLQYYLFLHLHLLRR